MLRKSGFIPMLEQNGQAHEAEKKTDYRKPATSVNILNPVDEKPKEKSQFAGMR